MSVDNSPPAPATPPAIAAATPASVDLERLQKLRVPEDYARNLEHDLELLQGGIPAPWEVREIEVPAPQSGGSLGTIIHLVSSQGPFVLAVEPRPQSAAEATYRARLLAHQIATARSAAPAAIRRALRAEMIVSLATALVNALEVPTADHAGRALGLAERLQIAIREAAVAAAAWRCAEQDGSGA
jgi:hypothetical protein